MSTKEQALWMLDASEVRAGQTWQHVKTGRRYMVIATGVDESTLAPVVVYAGPDGVVWVRALEVFVGNTDEGKARFLLITDDTESQTAPFERPLFEGKCCPAHVRPDGYHSVDCVSRKSGWRPTDGFEERPSAFDHGGEA